MLREYEAPTAGPPAPAMLRIPVECDECGYEWLSAARSGRTTCPDCGARIYIPDEMRRRYQLTATPPHVFGGRGSMRPEPKPRPRRTRDERQPTPFDPAPLSHTLQAVVKFLGRDHERERQSQVRETSRSDSSLGFMAQRAAARTYERTTRRTKLRRTTATLACGHLTSLNGPPAAWRRGTSALCPTCDQWHNVVAAREG
ncbi:MAG: hypothetical protein ACRDZ1_11625 [Acidimicrobiia bacterium]